MLLLVRLFGVLIIGLGSVCLLKPEVFTQLINFWRQEKRLYLLGVLRVIIGTVMLLTASQCRLTAVVLVLGILIFIKGVMIFILGPDKIESMLTWWGNRPVFVLRLMALVALVFGALLIYSA